MQHHQYSIMAGLAIFMLILSTSQISAKPPSCCTKVSTDEIKVEILSYSYQNGKPPCVPAIIFETKEGPKCSAPRQDWVRRIIKELRSLKTLTLRDNSTSTTGSPMTTLL